MDAKQRLALCRVVFFSTLLAMYAFEDFSFCSELSVISWSPQSYWVWLGQSMVPSTEALKLLQGAWTIGLVGAAIGFFYRTSSVIAAAGTLYLFPLQYSVGRLSHEMGATAIASVIMACSFAADAWAIDSWRNRTGGRSQVLDRPAWNYTWPVDAVRILLSVVFCSAGLSKLLRSGYQWAWSDNILALLEWRQTSIGLWLAQFPLLCRISGVVALLVEIGHPASLLNRRVAQVIVPLGIALLVGFWWVLGIQFFPLMVLHVFWLPLFRRKPLQTTYEKEPQDA